MKLKKIVSLALAGILAVSMLAGCGNSNTDNDQDDTVVTPVDTSFAAAVNAELSTAAKNTLAISADSSLEAMLNNVAGKIATDVLEDTVNNNGVVNGGKRVGFILTKDAQDVRHLLDLDDDASLTTDIKGNYRAPSGSGYIAGVASTGGWKYFTVVDSSKTTFDLLVVDGDYTDEGLAEEVADTLKALMTDERMPGEGIYNATSKKYDYNYTGHIASVKVDNLRGDNSYYVVALEITQTPTEVVNAKN